MKTFIKLGLESIEQGMYELKFDEKLKLYYVNDEMIHGRLFFDEKDLKRSQVSNKIEDFFNDSYMFFKRHRDGSTSCEGGGSRGNDDDNFFLRWYYEKRIPIAKKDLHKWSIHAETTIESPGSCLMISIAKFAGFLENGDIKWEPFIREHNEDFAKKYIRTSNSIVAFGQKYHISKDKVEVLTMDNLNDIAKFNNWKIVAISDSVNKLCDKLIVHNKKNYNSYINQDVDINLKALKFRYEEAFKHFDDYDIFGAIWTSYGLKYVAKLYDKDGELEVKKDLDFLKKYEIR